MNSLASWACVMTLMVAARSNGVCASEREECIQTRLRSFHGYEYRKTLSDLKVAHGGPITSMTLIKEDPLLEFKGRCIKGYSFDNQYSRLYVRHGCQGDFSVCYKNKAVCETKKLKSGVKGLIKFYYAPKGKNYTSISLTKETGIGPDGDLSKISKCRDPTRKLIPTENGDAFGVGNNKKQVFIFNHCSGTFRVCYTRPPLAPNVTAGQCAETADCTQDSCVLSLQNRCYNLYPLTEATMNVDDALMACKEKYGPWAELPPADDMADLKAIEQLSGTAGAQGGGVWMGASMRRSGCKTWRWNGSHYNVDAALWSPGYPMAERCPNTGCRCIVAEFKDFGMIRDDGQQEYKGLHNRGCSSDEELGHPRNVVCAVDRALDGQDTC